MLEAVKMQVMGRGNDGQLGTCGLGPFEARTCLWGGVRVRISVAQRRIWMSPCLALRPCASCGGVSVAARAGGDTLRCG